ncbi:glycosyltransferase family 41 protein [Roseomonas sp. HF4]|uniref:tetratricopeptide repeat protein n=1 Tax=Roseomonas sp. HF4 TaxID=2562313 RepID=UPI0010C0031F|nr:glycosyltransferase family 41 protein [Roseomonas sp. HF4]
MSAADPLQAALALHQAGRLDEAIRAYRRLLPADRGGVQVNRLLGLAMFARGDGAAALRHLQAAAARAPRDAALLNDTGNVLRALARRPEALATFRRAIEAAPGLADARFNLADCLLELGRHAEALDAYDAIAALRLPGMDADFHNNRGAALAGLDRVEDALGAFRAALALDPAHPGAAANAGEMLQRLGRSRESVEALTAFVRQRGATPGLLLVLGQGLLNLDLPGPALEAFDAVLRGDAAHEQALQGRGAALTGLKRHEEALAVLDAAIRRNPSSRAALVLAGNAHAARKDIEAAAVAYSRAAAIPHGRRPDAALAMMAYGRLRACDWTALDATRARLRGGAAAGTDVLPPFEALCLFDDPALHRRAAERHIRDNHAGPRRALRPPRQAGRIRLGYVSGEFREHAVGHLIARLLELHDRDAFEVHAFSIGPATGDAVQGRIRAAVHAFHDCERLPEDAVLARADAAGLDIAVDLNGFTGGSRTALFAAGLAPVQVNFLGYPGTMGARFIDYAIADAVVVPPGAEADWTEAVVRLPHAALPTDDRRPVATEGLSRARFGLPEDAFVFCCFNNTHKILPEAFDAWMRILGAVPGSVLWLREENAPATRNLRAAAAARGVDPARLVFAGRVDFAEHLGRHALADLFLDTLPYNAHTTAADALGAGLPVLTRPGRAFAGRVAASLLQAAGLLGMVVDSAEAYEATAIALAADPARLGAIRAALAAALPSCPLFDTPRYARNIERAFREMRDRAAAGRPPEGFTVADLPGA